MAVSAILLNLSMSYHSPALQNYLASRKKNDNTTGVIQKLKDNLPVLSTIIDYGGKSSIDDILHLEQSDTSPKSYNNFQKLLLQSNQSSDSNTRSKKYLSFIDYKAQPSKAKQSQRKKTSTKNLKTSIVVDMPPELKQMKNQILLLPSVGQSRLITNKQSSNVGSRLIQSLNKSHSRRYQTQGSEATGNRLQQYKKNYLMSLKDIMTQFESPQINCNTTFLQLHKGCKRILQQEQVLQKQYKKFESLGSPPNRIIHLNSLLNKFSTTIQKNIDMETAEQISNMDSKRYDIVLKHEEQARKYNLSKFREKKKQDKLEQMKGGGIQSNGSESEGLGFKLNSKGKLIYLNKSKGK